MAKYIDFILAGKSESGKTSIWTIQNKEDGTWLGYIQWFPRWGVYAFFPAGHTVFEKTCLRDIANFIEEKNNERKNERKWVKKNI